MTNQQGTEATLRGIGVSPGVAVGTPVWLHKTAVAVEERSLTDAEVAVELTRLRDAVGRAKIEIEELKQHVEKNVGAAEAEVFEAHLSFLADPSYVGEMERRIQAEHLNPEVVCARVTEETRAMLASLPSEYMQARADDIRDVGARLLRCLTGEAATDLQDLPEHSVLVTEELVPSDLSGLSRNVVGLVTALGSKTAHTAILARTMGLPSVYGVGDHIHAITEGQTIIVDGDSGTVTVNPGSATLEEARASAAGKAESLRAALERAHETAQTKDGKRIDVFANIGGPHDVASALENGSDGVGLFRTEFLYLENDHWPTEEEQYNAYKEVLSAFNTRPVVIRTLDIGGDKHLPYEALPTEENPFLGLRAIRYCLAREDIFRPQIRALLRASVHGTLWIMFPMAETLDEIRKAKQLVDSCRRELEAEGRAVARDIPLGIMVETPAAAVTADILAREADFFSIGTNDLTQYTLAADRGNPTVEYLYDAAHPAVLRLIQMTCQAAQNAGIPVGMCGELAGDVNMTALLVALGVQELSMSATFVPSVKERVRTVSADVDAARVNDWLAQEDGAAVLDKLNA